MPEEGEAFVLDRGSDLSDQSRVKEAVAELLAGISPDGLTYLAAAALEALRPHLVSRATPFDEGDRERVLASFRALIAMLEETRRHGGEDATIGFGLVDVVLGLLNVCEAIFASAETLGKPASAGG